MFELEQMSDEEFNHKQGRKCVKCGSFIEPLHNHHILPKYMGGKDEDGRILLCEYPCHVHLQDYAEIELRPLWLDDQPHDVLLVRAKVITQRWLNGAI